MIDRKTKELDEEPYVTLYAMDACTKERGIVELISFISFSVFLSIVSRRARIDESMNNSYILRVRKDFYGSGAGKVEIKSFECVTIESVIDTMKVAS